jgi:hypothetical protein
MHLDHHVVREDRDGFHELFDEDSASLIDRRAPPCLEVRVLQNVAISDCSG